MNKKLLLVFMLASVWFFSRAQWSNDPMQNLEITSLSEEQAISKTAVCPNGDYYIGYFSLEGGNYKVRLQRLDSAGNMLWQDNGIVISDHPSMSWLTDWDMTADHENHAILTWQDIRSAGNNNTVAYRISPEGDFIWGENGIMLSNSADFDAAPKVTVTNSNNAVFAWQSTYNIIRQKISPDGTKQWGEWGITMSGDNTFSWPQLIAVGDDEIIMKYYYDSGPTWAPTRHLYAQKFDASGEAVWPSAVVINNEGNIQAWHQILSFVNDGNDGFYIAWHDYTISGTEASAWVQHINANGEPQFATNGVLVSTRSSFNQFNPKLASPQGDENVYIYWTEVNGNQNQWGLYGQKINAQGEREWTDNGKMIYAVGNDYYNLYFTETVDSDLLIVYEKGDAQIKAARINALGEFVWEPSESSIGNTTGTKVHISKASLRNNQWVFAWTENRSGSLNIYAQNLNTNGSIGESLEPGLFSVTMNVDLTDMEGYFDPDLDVIYLTGSLLGWSEPGADHENQVLSRIGESMIWSITFELEAGDYEYKYFLNAGWSGGEWAGSDNRAVTVMQDVVLDDVWTPSNIHSLNLMIQPEDAGTVYGAGIYHSNAFVSVSALPAEDFSFISWTDDEETIMSTDANYAFNMPEAATNLTANFEALAPQTYTLALLANPAEGGTIEGGGEFAEGTEVVVSAFANEGFVFVKWTDDEEIEVSTDAAFSYTMPAADATLTAHFDLENSVNGLFAKQVNIFPNPALNFLTVTAGSTIKRVIITDITGRQVYERSVNDTQISIQHRLNKGIYMVQIYTREGLTIKKLQILQ